MLTQIDNRAEALREAALYHVRREWTNLIDGARRTALDGEIIEVMDPSLGMVLALAPAGKQADIDLAVAAARRAFDEQRWMGLGPQERTRILLKAAELIAARAEQFIAIEMLNIGVPRHVSEWIVQFAVDAFRHYAGWIGKVGGSTSDISSVQQAYHAYTLKEPAGVSGIIIPWNGPIGAAAMKLACALAAGCTCVLKPPEEAPLSSLLLGELLMEAGVPAGVMNVVSGLGHLAGAALAAHPQVDKINFTGSTEVARHIIGAAAGNLKKVSLELGGKSPVLIFDDADLDAAITGAAHGTFFNSGQICVAGSRVYVQRAIYDQVCEGIAEVGRGMRVGDAFESGALIGPLISAKQLAHVNGMIQAARDIGAEVIGGGAPQGGGYFIEPTLVRNAPQNARVAREEIFGPVITAIPFDTIKEGIALANDTNYGLAAAIWTRSFDRAHHYARAVRAGTVWINCQMVLDFNMPFGGYKQSGWGREHGREGVESFMQTKSVIGALNSI